MKKLLFILPVFSFLLSSCFTLQYSTREPALVENVDVDETIKVARDEMQTGGMGRGLAIWVLKDQVITPVQARALASLYLQYIDSMGSEFNIWHASWAISNLYRLGDTDVKAELETAYQKAIRQPERLKEPIKGFASSHISGKELTTGFIHFGGLYYAHGHLVVPGNKKYIQSYREYRQKEDN